MSSRNRCTPCGVLSARSVRSSAGVKVLPSFTPDILVDTSARPGVGLPGAVTMREAATLAAEAESAGASSVWVTDVRREPYLTSAAALRATVSVTVGTDVAVAFSRSPAVTAQAAWDLAGYGGGRFILGLGSQVGPTLRSRFGVQADRPAAR